MFRATESVLLLFPSVSLHWILSKTFITAHQLFNQVLYKINRGWKILSCLSLFLNNVCNKHLLLCDKDLILCHKHLVLCHKHLAQCHQHLVLCDKHLICFTLNLKWALTFYFHFLSLLLLSRSLLDIRSVCVKWIYLISHQAEFIMIVSVWVSTPWSTTIFNLVRFSVRTHTAW